MAKEATLGSSLIRGHCPRCQATILVHDGSTGEITCQMCAHTWSCEPSQPGHERCGGTLTLKYDPSTNPRKK